MNLEIIYPWLTTLIIVAIIAVIIFIIFSILLYPIKKRNDLKKERDKEKAEVQKIQAQKGYEWESYQRLQDELDKLRKAYFDSKKKLEDKVIEMAKLETDKDNLKAALEVNKKELTKVKKNEAT